jgi:hypothetical protein
MTSNIPPMMPGAGVTQTARSDHGVFVAVVEGAIVGFCDCIRSRDEDAAPDTGEIASIYVDPRVGEPASAAR